MEKEQGHIYILAYIYLRSGKHDNDLNWPFDHSITIRLVDQKEGKNHHDYIVDFGTAPDKYTKRVEKVGDYSGWGIPRFISHSKLSPNYLVNNSLCFCVF